jgi:cobalt/nickel transport system permease protein
MVIEEVFISGNFVIHGLDPRAKIVAAFAFSIVVAVCDRFAALAVAVGVSAALILVARLPLKKVLRRLIIVNGLILFLWLFLPFTFQGTPLFTVGPLTATREGIAYATVITLKSNAIIMALMALVATMPVFTLGRAMRHLRVPSTMAYLFLFTYRYIHVIYAEYQRLMRAIKIRGFRPVTNMHTYRTYAYLVGMILVKSHDRSQRVRAAMLCRGFQGRFYDLSQFAFRSSDFVMMLMMLAAVTGIGLLQWLS